MIDTKEKIKLNLGSRDRVIPGFKNMDCDAHPNVDYVGDVSNLSHLKDGEVSEIYASHILEHFPHVRTLEILKEWNRVLEVGGILYIGVPDFKRTIEIYRKVGHLTDWMVNFLWGDKGYKTAFHYSGFDAKRLSGLLLAAGFSEASQVENFQYNIDDCSAKVSTLDFKIVSLNMVAIK